MTFIIRRNNALLYFCDSPLLNKPEYTAALLQFLIDVCQPPRENAALVKCVEDMFETWQRCVLSFALIFVYYSVILVFQPL